MALFTQLKDIWARLPMSGRIATVGSAAATLALIGAIVYYGSQPDYGVLFADLKPADAQSIVEKLQTANVPYSVTNGGTTIQVPHERISELRLQMAGEGALSGGHVGFDLFDKTSFGATDFAQQVNYRRAIEGELAKTLEGMDEVESARVHITPKKESVFADKEEGAKASIMLKVRQNEELSGERSEAIVSLVSSSIEGLDPSRISVMDTRGRLLIAAGSGRNDPSNGASAFNAQLEAKQKYEAENAARIVSMLEPVVGENKVRADVSADLDFSHREQSEEKYNPQSQVVRSQQTSTEARNSSSAGQNGGVAGARSNNPATQTPTVQPAPVTSGDQRNTSTVNYEIDKTVTKTVGGGGRVNRMTVSVVVDHKNVNDVEVARSSEELKQIQDLVSAAVGINAERGDSVVVQTMPFNKLPTEENAAAPFLERNKQLVSSLTKYGALIVVAILLLLFAIRPTLRALKAAGAPSNDQNLLGNGGDSGERRNLALQSAEGSDGTDMQSMMTVGELQARMDAGVDSRAAQKGERVETIRKQLVDQTLNDTDMVVSTMRGWLAEKS